MKHPTIIKNTTLKNKKTSSIKTSISPRLMEELLEKNTSLKTMLENFKLLDKKENIKPGKYDKIQPLIGLGLLGAVIGTGGTLIGMKFLKTKKNKELILQDLRNIAISKNIDITISEAEQMTNMNDIIQSNMLLLNGNELISYISQNDNIITKLFNTRRLKAFTAPETSLKRVKSMSDLFRRKDKSDNKSRSLTGSPTKNPETPHRKRAISSMIYDIFSREEENNDSENSLEESKKWEKIHQDQIKKKNLHKK